MATLRDVIRSTHRILEAEDIPDPRLEAEVMVMSHMRMPRQDIFSNQENEVSGLQERELAVTVKRRLTREPLAYILGIREFYGINLLVNSEVLIPRPETESLVEHALFMALMGMETTELAIADVGTGTGAIAINLALHLPAARIYAVDSSDSALDVAAYNIRTHNVADRVTLAKGDLLVPVPEPVDLIVANLPYMPTARIPALQPEIQWEPKLALDGGEDGLDAIRRLLSQAPSKVKEQATILLELDPEQVPAVEELAKTYFPNATTSVEKDLAQLDRIFVISHGVGDD
ncbi:MAG TPA: peptide chain release factor N(5)-glutamine methyltransferase [Dehalococcoidia bacterium]|nr:peptide chain release factor N(5)-glutamine methyltransferase [Dehalococcoidia bacterium]